MRGVRRWRSDREAIAHHYDLSNDFYALFLDPRMVYTCAYYRDPDGDLARAQEDKLDLICRKLELAAGERLLDVGCGWGALVCWAAERYGVAAHGVTLSRAQAVWAESAIDRAGLGPHARVEYRDWRDLPPGERADKIAAVGIIEHVGPRRRRAFLERLWSWLRPGGLLLNQGITHRAEWRPTSLQRFLDDHVFPNGALDHLSAFLDDAERVGFEVVDVESLRTHYARTCRQWAQRLEANAASARRLVGERVYRTWLLYLASASVAFEQGSIGLYQSVLRKPDPAAGATAPWTREVRYRLPDRPHPVRAAG